MVPVELLILIGIAPRSSHSFTMTGNHSVVVNHGWWTCHQPHTKNPDTLMWLVNLQVTDIRRFSVYGEGRLS